MSTSSRSRVSAFHPCPDCGSRLVPCRCTPCSICESGHPTGDPCPATVSERDRYRLMAMRLVDVERDRQVAQHGYNDDVPLGMGSGVQWLAGVGPTLDQMIGSALEAACRVEYEEYVDENGGPTWMHLIREEVAEVFAEDDPDQRAVELVQVAALCVSLVEQHLRKTAERDG